ncbi:MAG: ATP synthase F1 subunit delta [Nitrospiraceae bacterium]|nr:MAG: ATP synthase F1 subunit delta [Nitrospiraceae bacterium]
MNKNQVAKKYSRALINSIGIADMPRVIEEFKAFAGLIDKKRQLRLLFAGQIFSEVEKGKAFDAAAPAMKFHPGTEKFLRLMITRGHLSAIKEIVAASIEAYNDRQKKATAVVTSTIALSETYRERLRDALRLMTGREITVENRIDEALLGGFIVRVGSTIFDSSIRGQLRLLRADLVR